MNQEASVRSSDEAISPGGSRVVRLRLTHRRLAFAAIAGVAAGWFTMWWQAHVNVRASDFAQLWWAARGWRSGLNPYDVVGPEPWRLFHWDYPLFYPLPAVMFTVPFSYVPLWLAEAVFVGISTAWLAWTLTRDRWLAPTLWLFASSSMLSVLQTAQWSAALTAAALTPSFGWLLVAKPQIGLPLFVAWPSRKAAYGCIAVVLLCTALWPEWLAQWLAVIRSDSAQHITPPLLAPGGFLLAFAVLRWRRPDARLLLALAVVPHTHARYELLPLFLLATCWEEGVALTALMALAYVLAIQWAPSGADLNTLFALNARLMTWCVYLPCLVMVLPRKNTDTPRTDRDASVAWSSDGAAPAEIAVTESLRASPGRG